MRSIPCPYCSAQKPDAEVVCPTCHRAERAEEVRLRVLSRNRWMDSPWTPGFFGAALVAELAVAIAQPRHIFGFWIVVAGLAGAFIAKGVGLHYRWRDSQIQGDPLLWRDSVRGVIEDFPGTFGLVLCVISPDTGPLPYVGLAFVLISCVLAFKNFRSARKKRAARRAAAPSQE